MKLLKNVLSNGEKQFIKDLPHYYVHAKKYIAGKYVEERLNTYFKFYETYYDILTNKESKIKEKVTALNNYKNAIKNNSYSPQDKFSSSVIEEFLSVLLCIITKDTAFEIGSIKAYSNLYFSMGHNKDLNMKINHKDQDVAIYKTLTLECNEQQVQVHVPIVSIECKTYLDKTMLEGSLSTADKISTGSPDCLFFIVTETYDVDSNVQASSLNIDNVFILRKQKRKGKEAHNEIDSNVIEKLYKTIKKHVCRERKSMDDLIKRGYLKD